MIFRCAWEDLKVRSPTYSLYRFPNMVLGVLFLDPFGGLGMQGLGKSELQKPPG